MAQTFDTVKSKLEQMFDFTRTTRYAGDVTKGLDAIRTHIDEQGFAPSFREIGNAAGLKSPSSVKHQLQVLEDKGFIRMNANKGRAI